MRFIFVCVFLSGSKKNVKETEKLKVNTKSERKVKMRERQNWINKNVFMQRCHTDVVWTLDNIRSNHSLSWPLTHAATMPFCVTLNGSNYNLWIEENNFLLFFLNYAHSFRQSIVSIILSYLATEIKRIQINSFSLLSIRHIFEEFISFRLNRHSYKINSKDSN